MALRFLLAAASDSVSGLGIDLPCRWSTNGSYTDCETRIVLDFTPFARRRTPLSDVAWDIGIGEALHEAAHCICTTARARPLLQKPPTDPVSLTFDWHVFNMLEDGYIEEWLRRTYPRLDAYLKALHRYYASAKRQNSWKTEIINSPDLAHLMLALLGFAVLDWDILEATEDLARERLSVLQEAASHYRNLHSLPERVEKSLGVSRLFRSWFGEEITQAKVEQFISFNGRPCAAEHGGKPLPPDLAREVERLVASGAIELATPDSGRSSAIRRTIIVSGKPNQTLARRLAEETRREARGIDRAFRLRLARRRTKARGLTSGKLSTSRLHRLLAGAENIFERPRQLNTAAAIVVLLDASSSMKTNWKVLQRCAAAVCEGLRFSAITLNIIAYRGVNDTCELTRLFDSDAHELLLDGVSPRGNTPSAEALLGILQLQLRQATREKAIFHFTDGAADDEDALQAALTELRRAGWHPFAIGLEESRAREQLEKCYGSHGFKLISRVVELPQALSGLIQEMLIR